MAGILNCLKYWYSYLSKKLVSYDNLPLQQRRKDQDHWLDFYGGLGNEPEHSSGKLSTHFNDPIKRLIKFS